MTNDDPIDNAQKNRVIPLSRRKALQIGGLLTTGSSLGFYGGSDIVSATNASDYQQVRQQARNTIIGKNLNNSNLRISDRIGKINSTAQSYWNHLDRNCSSCILFDNVEFPTTSRELIRSYDRLLTMAKAYLLPDGKLEDDPELLEDIKYGLDYLYENYYNKNSNISSRFGYHFRVYIPHQLVKITLLLHSKLSESQRSKYMNAVGYWKSPYGGPHDGDRGWFGFTTAGRGAVIEDATEIEKGVAELEPLFSYVDNPPGNGYYKDGSYLNHGNQASNGAYGRTALVGSSLLLSIIRGTLWDPTDTDWFQNYLEIIKNGYVRIMYDGALMNRVFGRSISRNSSGGPLGAVYPLSADILVYILRISQIAPDKTAASFKKFVKYQIQSVDFYDPLQRFPIAELNIASDLLNSNSSAADAGLGNHVFHNMDMAAMKTSEFAVEIAQHSTRIANYESLNGENQHGWHQGRGMTLLHTEDQSQFSDAYWPTVNAYRMPGTTVVSKTLSDGAFQGQTSNANWVGGSSLGNVAASGMRINPNYASITGKKSWLMFNDEIVCLGADITTEGEAESTETTVLNRKLNSDGDNRFVIDDTAVAPDLGWSENLSNPSWVWLEDTGGYYFPSGQTFRAKREERTGEGDDINTISDEWPQNNVYHHNYLTFWKDHGTNPTGATYEYVLLPNRTRNQTADYASNPEITVLANDATKQAAKTRTYLAANFWSKGSITESNPDHRLKVSGPASVAIERQGEDEEENEDKEIYIGVADPTQTQDAVTVEFDHHTNALKTDDETVTVKQIKPTVKMDVDVGGSSGATHTATFSVSPSNSAAEFDVTAPEGGIAEQDGIKVEASLGWFSQQPIRNLEIYPDLPDGWTVASEENDLPDKLHRDEHATASWILSPPENTENSDQELLVVATYRTRGSKQTLKDKATVEPKTIVGQWKFNKGSGSVVMDSSGNNNDGTIHGARWVGNDALSFDGHNDYIDFGNPEILRTNMPMTVSLWFKPKSWSNGQNRLIDYGWRGATNYVGYSIMASDSTLLGVYGGNGYNFYITRSNITPQIDQWHHVVYTIEDGDQGLYLDGAEIADSSHKTSIIYGSEPLYIGAAANKKRYFNGSIDDTRIYDGALSLNNVKYLYENGRQ